MELNSINDLINDYEELYVFTNNKIQEVVADVLRKYKITFEQLCILRMLELKPGMNSTVIAGRLGINKSGVSIRVNRLLDRKLIKKKQVDNREFGLYNSEEGRRIYDEAHVKIEQLVAKWVEAVGETDARAFIRIYKKVNEIIIKLENV